MPPPNLTDAHRVDLLLPAILLRRVIAAVIKGHEQDGDNPVTHPLMPALALIDKDAEIGVADLPKAKADKLNRRAWRTASVALERMQERPIASAMVAVTELLQLVIDDGTLVLDDDGPLMQGFRIVAAVTEAPEQEGARNVLKTVERSARKAGMRMLEDLRKIGAMMPPTRLVEANQAEAAE